MSGLLTPSLSPDLWICILGTKIQGSKELLQLLCKDMRELKEGHITGYQGESHPSFLSGS